MKKFQYIFFLIAAIVINICFSQCKKDDSKLNIKLKDKTLAQIKANIYGKWQLYYTIGGFTGNIRQTFLNSFIEFTSTDSIRWTSNDTLFINDKIKWVRTTDIFNDSTYICSFNDFVTYPHTLIIDGIYNDTLTLISNTIEPDGYSLTRKK